MIGVLVIPAKPNRRICSIAEFRDDGVAVLEYFADSHWVIMSFVIEWKRFALRLVGRLHYSLYCE